MRVLKDKIKTLLGREEIKKRIDSSEFYFEKGRQVLKVFEQLSVTDEVKTYLINNKKNYTFLKDKFENHLDYKEIGRLIFTIISYCDSNAYKKAIYNEYEDKRVLALAFVRMNNWAEQLISYKFEYDNDITKLPIGSIRNAIAYLKKPSENFTMLSENHRRQVTERLFNKEYTSKNFAKYFSDFFQEFKISLKNIDNLTAILSSICYLMKEEWLVEDAKGFVKDMNLEKILNLLKYKKQIILQGPLGTGKTREAKQIAKALLNIAEDENLKNGEQFQIIQFHPSYSYEDFVRGIVAKPNSDRDGITYEAENKLLAKFAKKALENYQNSQKDVQILSEENKVLKYFEAFKDDLNDKIEENNGFNLTESVILLPSEDEDAFRYKGNGEIGWSQGKGLRMLHNDILQAHFDGNTSRQDIKKNQNLSGLARQHASYYVRVLNLFQKFIEDNPNLIKEEKPENDLKNYVLIIDEINRANLSSVLGELIYALEYRGEAVDSMYEVDGSNKITLPPNFYIIGTMNTADRSVGHIDYAIRRRFAFVDVLPRDLSSELGDKFEKGKFIEVSRLFIKDFDLEEDSSKEKIEKSDYLSNEFDVKDVWLGHSYFITEKTDIQTRLEYEIKPILREYVKDGVLKESASDEIEKL